MYRTPFFWCQFCMGKYILQTSFFFPFQFAVGLTVSPGAVKYILTPITAFIKNTKPPGLFSSNIPKNSKLFPRSSVLVLTLVLVHRNRNVHICCVVHLGSYIFPRVVMESNTSQISTCLLLVMINVDVKSRFRNAWCGGDARQITDYHYKYL